MKNVFVFTCVCLIILFYGVISNVSANGLSAPTGSSCVTDNTDPCSDGDFFLDWIDVASADKYTVSIECENTDGLLSQEISAGTSECDGIDIICDSLTDSDICISSSLFTLPDNTWTCSYKVRGLDPGNGRGRQNARKNGGVGQGQATGACPNPF